MEATALKIVDVVEAKELSALEKKAFDYADGIKNLPAIKTQEEYLQVGTLWKIGKELLKEIDEGYKDLVRAADKLHKDMVAKRAKYYNPTDAGVRAAKKLMDNYEQEMERIRLAEQKRLEDIAKKEEEERRLLEAIEAEEEAKANGATAQEAAQEAEAVLQEPVYTQLIILPKETPKVKGLSFRTIWKFRIKDINKIPREYMIPNEVKIGGVVRALKGQSNIPGVEPYEERV